MNADKSNPEDGDTHKNGNAKQNVYEVPREDEDELFALSFGSGAFDAMVQLGVIHALLVARRRPPNVVLGLSTGAINAVALGEVFAEPGGLDGQVSRFREILNAARNSLRVLRHELSPDPLELNTEHALAPMELPIHHRKERDERVGALRAVVGLLRLFNDVTKLQITLHVLVQAAQRYLHLKEARASRNRIQRWKRVPPAVLRCISFLVCYSWRLFFPLLRACRRVSLLPPENTQKHWRTASVSHFLSILRRIITLAPSRAIKTLLFMSGLSFSIYQLAHLLPDSLWWPLNWILAAIIIPIAIAIVVIVMAFIVYHDRHLLLKAYDLHDQLFHPYVIKQFLISTFHPHYYGRFDHASAAEYALAELDTAINDQEAPPKTFANYLWPENDTHGIRIVVVGTSLKNGKSIGFSKHTKIIDGMMASMAFPPFLKAYEVDGKLYIDPACVGEEPIAPLMDYLRTNMDPRTKAAHVFHVVPFPAEQLDPKKDSGTSISAIAARSFELLRSRRITIERELTEQYSGLLPNGNAIHKFSGTTEQFVSANLFPIETEYPLHITERFLATPSNEEREHIVLHAVATGCRIALQRMLAPETTRLDRERNRAPIKCRQLLDNLDLVRAGTKEQFPGTDLNSGPGLHEICHYCTLHPLSELDKIQQSERQVLQPINIERLQPIWPTLAEYQNKPLIKTCNSQQFPTTSNDPHNFPPNPTPWISTVWSGGVFRGVFQIGAIAAYNEAGIKPRVFAGASVGSIMAALAARVTSQDKLKGRITVQKAAATFIGLDRFVITDRFADLVRRLTIRANDVHVTPKMLDDVCRQFDHLSSDRFNHAVREVAAGFERLLYISPFELLELYRAMHNADGEALGSQLAHAVDYLFERSGAGLEMLGAEPLKMLIAEHVLEGIPQKEQRSISVEDFLKTLSGAAADPYLLISTTDLTNGKLHMIGGKSYRHNLAKGDKSPLLVEALLAGSAFPAVFRPRRHSEVYPTGEQSTVFVDGGIMDNLPLSPVVKFLEEAAQKGLLARRPSHPHLILSASLESRVEVFSDESEIERRFGNDWRALNRRVTELQYNRKVTAFTNAQRDFQTIYRATQATAQKPPLDLIVGTTKPAWLCGTFGFHPMLGFSQVKQAESIAHGCAMTLATLHQLSSRNPNEAWGISIGSIDKEAFQGDPINPAQTDEFVVNSDYLESLPWKKRKEKSANGLCWFRNEICPFSANGIKETGESFAKETTTALIMIYNLCGQASTHSRQNH